MEGRHEMTGVLDLIPFSQRPRLHLKEAVFLVFPKCKRMNLNPSPTWLRTFAFSVEKFIIKKWISTLKRAGMKIMPCPYDFIYDSDTVPKCHITGFLNNVAENAVVFRTPRSHPQNFQIHFNSIFMDFDCHPSGSDAVISILSWRTRKRTWDEAKSPCRRLRTSTWLD